MEGPFGNTIKKKKKKKNKKNKKKKKKKKARKIYKIKIRISNNIKEKGKMLTHKPQTPQHTT